MRGDPSTNGEAKISVAVTSPGWPPGAFANGVIPYVDMLTGAMRRMGHQAFVLTQNAEEACENDFVVGLPPNGRSERNLPQRLYDVLTYRLWPDRRNAIRISESLRVQVDRLVRERGVQLVEMDESFGIAHRLIPAVSVPVVVRMHGPWFLNGQALGVKQDSAFARRVHWEKLAIQAAAGVSSPSLNVLNHVRERYSLAPPHAQVIHPQINPVAESERWTLKGCPPSEILFVGRFDRHKGGDMMIDTFERLAQAQPDCRLTFVGPDRGFLDDDGRRWTLEQYVHDRIHSPANRSRFRWLGFRSRGEIVQLRRQAMVTVVCSRYENFPMAALEAMALGCPLVATAVGGIPEVITDEHNGLLCRTDAVDLADKIETLLTNPRLAQRLGHQAAIDCEQKYHPDLIAKQTLAFYLRILERYQ